MVNSGIIQGFHYIIDNSKIGYNDIKIDIFLKEHKHRKSLIAYMSTKPYFITLNVAIGWADIEPEIFVKDIDSLLEVMEDLDSKFPMMIKRQTYQIVEKVHMQRTIPEIEFK